ncbi:phosphatidylethanolamine-binding protein [Purpureocillium lilacinum]|uniref:Phosphatidylethanolamine-binding protein n=1 Tax=Purpureocillium lilacinum TaxID=33203 RepID=A0A179GKS9_PURLI|nr:phosphatidylethanolamine-binding protein [Purpureocillium lilacinum]OAQ77961.1 phosphatidylethanolamine-binding protein [Purpureocillium lilacinum]
MATPSGDDQLATSLLRADLVPGCASGLIPSDFKPSTALAVAYDGKQVELGNLFRAYECKLAPFISFEPEVRSYIPFSSPLFPIHQRRKEAERANVPSSASYTLMLVDPDAPTPEDPKFAFWRHWVLPGLQPLAGVDGVVAQTKPAVTDYLGPGPKDSSNPHRYLFLLFREPDGLDLTEADVGGHEFPQRRSFDAPAFVEQHKLTLVAVNWMRGAGDGWAE